MMFEKEIDLPLDPAGFLRGGSADHNQIIAVVQRVFDVIAEIGSGRQFFLVAEHPFNPLDSVFLPQIFRNMKAFQLFLDLLGDFDVSRFMPVGNKCVVMQVCHTQNDTGIRPVQRRKFQCLFEKGSRI